LKGFYLAIEGGEGAGKSTVASALAGRLSAEGKEVLVVREPGGTDLGEEIRRLLLHADSMTPWAEALLFAAQRSQLATEVISPALSAGKMVISDRSYYSSLAYQGGGRGLNMEQLRSINEVALEGVVPDLVVVLAVEVSVGLSRQTHPDRIGNDDREFANNVLASYRQMAALDPERVILIDASAEAAVVVDRLADLLKARLGG
jgi:dTMP kinase